MKKVMQMGKKVEQCLSYQTMNNWYRSAHVHPHRLRLVIIRNPMMLHQQSRLLRFIQKPLLHRLIALSPLPLRPLLDPFLSPILMKALHLQLLPLHLQHQLPPLLTPVRSQVVHEQHQLHPHPQHPPHSFMDIVTLILPGCLRRIHPTQPQSWIDLQPLLSLLLLICFPLFPNSCQSRRIKSLIK